MPPGALPNPLEHVLRPDGRIDPRALRMALFNAAYGGDRSPMAIGMRAITGFGQGDSGITCPFLTPLTNLLGNYGIGGIFGMIGNRYLQQLLRMFDGAMRPPAT